MGAWVVCQLTETILFPAPSASFFFFGFFLNSSSIRNSHFLITFFFSTYEEAPSYFNLCTRHQRAALQFSGFSHSLQYQHPTGAPVLVPAVPVLIKHTWKGTETTEVSLSLQPYGKPGWDFWAGSWVWPEKLSVQE